MQVQTTQLPPLNDSEDHPVYHPVKLLPIGLDGLPNSILNSKVFTGKDLQKLALLEYIPSEASINGCAERYRLTKKQSEEYYHKRAKLLITKNKMEDAIKVALYKGC